MPLYQDLIMDQIKNIGKPRVSKSTTETTAEPPNQGLDIGGLMMMLMMMNLFKQPPTGLASTLGPEAVPAAPSTLFPNLQGSPTLGSYGTPPGMDNMLSQLLMAFLSGGIGQGLPGAGIPSSPL